MEESNQPENRPPASRSENSASIEGTANRKGACAKQQFRLEQFLSQARYCGSKGGPSYEALSGQPRAPPGYFLNKNLLKFFITEDHALCAVRITRRNAAIRNNIQRLVEGLYGRPLREFTSEVAYNRRVKRVVDLYYLTERQICNRPRVQCGPKTLKALNEILQAYGLPATNSVLR